MSLTYSQKQYVQKNYPEKSIEEIAQVLHASEHSVKKHVNQNKHLFEPRKEKITEHHTPVPFSIWIKRNAPNVIFLIILILLIYSNGFTADFVSDDIQGIVELEKRLKTFAYVTDGYPTFMLRTFQLWLSYNLFGMVPFFFRIYSLLAHIGVVLMIYTLVPYFSKKKYLPVFVAALAAVHPMMIESVTWISGGIYSQSALYILISFYFYIRNSIEYSTRKIIISVAFFILGMSFSEKTIVFPFILTLYEYCYGNIRLRWARLLPYFGMSVLWGIIISTRIADRINYLQVTNGTGEKVNIYNPFIQIPVAVGTYIKLFFYPRHLTLYHSDFYRNSIELAVIIIGAISYFAALIYTFFMNKKLFFWFAFFITGLLVTMNPFGLSWVVAERYAYLPLFGIYYLVGYGLHTLVDTKRLKALGFGLFTVMLIGYSVRTVIRNIDWQNVDNLWIATGKASPSDPKTHNNLGDMYARHGDYPMAIKEFTRATELNPGYSAAYYNIGNTYRHMKNSEMALKYFLAALERNPSIWQAYMNIAIIKFEQRDMAGAEKYLKDGIQYDPKNPGFYANLGVIAYTQGKKEEAKQYLTQALALDPQNQFALSWMQKIASGT